MRNILRCSITATLLIACEPAEDINELFEQLEDATEGYSSEQLEDSGEPSPDPDEWEEDTENLEQEPEEIQNVPEESEENIENPEQEPEDTQNIPEENMENLEQEPEEIQNVPEESEENPNDPDHPSEQGEFEEPQENDVSSEPVEFTNECGGEICLTAPLDEGYGFVTEEAAHFIPASLASSFYSAASGGCINNTTPQAFRRFASRDYSPDGGNAGAYGIGIGDNFSNFRLALHQQNASINDFTLSFGWLEMQDDAEGVNYVFVEPEAMEWRIYDNLDLASTIELRFNDQPMLIGIMSEVHVELYYNRPADCSDDYVTMATNLAIDLHIANGAPAENIALAEAFLLDLDHQSFWVTVEHSNTANVRDLSGFDAQNVTLGTGFPSIFE